VRGLTIETASSMLAVPAIVGMAVVGPAGALIDRLGARRIILAGMTAQMLGNVLLAFSLTALSAALALGLLGAAGGVFWPGFNAMIGAVVPSGIRQRYFGINFTLVNLGIGGVLAGSIVDVHRPGTSVAIYLGNALSFLAPFVVLVGPLRHVSGKVALPGHRAGRLTGASVLWKVLRDKAMLSVIA
jgi:MFS family permease